MEKKKENITLYLYIHLKLWNRFGNEKENQIEANLKEVKNYLFEWRIPKSIRFEILKEMEKLNLLQIKNKFYINLVKPKIREDDFPALFVGNNEE